VIDNMAKFSFVAILTRVSKSLGCFMHNALKSSGLGVIGLNSIHGSIRKFKGAKHCTA
jgi:hypothetical protein